MTVLLVPTTFDQGPFIPNVEIRSGYKGEEDIKQRLCNGDSLLMFAQSRGELRSMARKVS